MTKELKIKIGQMLMCGFHTPYADEQAKRLSEEFYLGNYILFARNFESFRQAGRMNEMLSRMVYEKTGIAPFISTDQEGGNSSRIIEGAALIPGAMAIAAARGDAESIGKSTARLLKAIGVNQNLAPVADVNSNPFNPIIGIRSYGDTVQKVEKYLLPQLHGIQAGGIMGTLKHFPGHGNVKSDSHLSVPHNDASKEELYSVDFETFRAAVKAGADAVMSCHVVFDALDSENPATLSKRIMTGLLRQEMGFEGVIMTDCLEMGAIGSTVGAGEGAVRAVEAGCDMLCVSHTYEAASSAFNALYKAVESGRISEERINASYERIIRMKQKYGVTQPFEFDEAKAEALINDQTAIKQNDLTSRNGVTLIRDGGALPFEFTRPVFMAPYCLALTGFDNPDKTPANFAKDAAKYFGGEEIVLPLKALTEEVKQKILSSEGDVYVVGLYNARFNPAQAEALELIHEKGKPVIAVILGAPYDICATNPTDTVICAYEYTALSVKNALEALKENKFYGQLPVDI